MLRDQDFMFIDDTRYFRNTKSSDEYFRQIKIELRNIELARKRLKYSDFSDERKKKIQERLDSDENFWKKELDKIQNSQRKFKKKYKKKSMEQIKKEVLEIIEEKRKKNEDTLHLSNLSIKLNVKEKYVFQVLDQLNKEGIVSQPNHIKPHDCFRPNSNGWMDDIYHILKKE